MLTAVSPGVAGTAGWRGDPGPGSMGAAQLINNAAIAIDHQDTPATVGPG
jgi:hypothetical protein